MREPVVLLGCLFPLFVFTHSASAISIPLTVWDFSGHSGSEPTANSTPTAGFQTTLIARSASASPTALTDGFAAKGWPFTSTTNAFFEFSINPQSGTTYTITDIFLELVSTPGEGPSAWELRSDADGFAMNLDSFPFMPASGTYDIMLGPAFQNLTGPTTFRLYGLNSSGGLGGLMQLDINGTFTSSAVPETLPFGAFGLTVTLLLFARSRIKE